MACVDIQHEASAFNVRISTGATAFVVGGEPGGGFGWESSNHRRQSAAIRFIYLGKRAGDGAHTDALGRGKRLGSLSVCVACGVAFLDVRGKLLDCFRADTRAIERGKFACRQGHLCSSKLFRSTRQITAILGECGLHRRPFCGVQTQRAYGRLKVKHGWRTVVAIRKTLNDARAAINSPSTGHAINERRSCMECFGHISIETIVECLDAAQDSSVLA